MPPPTQEPWTAMPIMSAKRIKRQRMTGPLGRQSEELQQVFSSQPPAISGRTRRENREMAW